ncbi:carboxypeptidase M32 [Clostridiaceae bacterium 35-E11]
MILSDEEKLQKIKEHVKKIEYLRYTNNSLLYWDKISQMPPKGIGFRSEVMAFIAGEIHRLSQDQEFIDLVNYFKEKNPEDLDIKTNSMIRRINRNYEYTSKIPVEEYREYIHLIAGAEEVWEVCKKNNDFDTIAPYLEKIVNHFQQFAEYWGYEDEPYDALLSYYEAGVTVKIVDHMFTELRDCIVELLKKIQKSKVKIKKDVFKGNFDKEMQAKMMRDILNRIGFDFEAGRLDESVHPTILANSNRDVRILTSYHENDFRPAFTTALHEGGQALYEQGISADLYGTLLAESSSMGILEAIARFYENIFGKSQAFWDSYYPIMQGYFPSLKKVSCEDFLKALNSVESSFIRMDADELTYNLHIIIRYEIEKDLMNGKLSVKEIPSVWNQKYKDYLGIEPPSDCLGVLQDVHWFSGYWGYFPIYVLGNFYAAQIYEILKKEKPEYDQIIASGSWKEINEWFKEKIFVHGAIYNPQELIYLVTDENLKAEYFINYLNEKYRRIYEI